jgi:hypothetical protein
MRPLNDISGGGVLVGFVLLSSSFADIPEYAYVICRQFSGLYDIPPPVAVS